VEEPASATNPSWSTYLDEVSALGYAGTELGPLGYLPVDVGALREALAERGLELDAGYVMEPLATADALDATLQRTRETAEILQALGAGRLVLIDAIHPERSATSGRPEAAPRLDDDGFKTLVIAVEAVSQLASDEFGLETVFHHHVGTYVEFRDELERLLAATEVRLCLDSGHAVYAGIDPVDLFRAHADRVGYMHLKDVDAEVLREAQEAGLTFEDAVDRGIFCPVGSGSVDYSSLFAEVERSAFTGWVAVEQDRDVLEPGSGLAAEDARRSIDYIRTAGLS
jgi:inosose dehydratase